MARTFSGSTIKSWFQYRCERKTRYELFTDAELDAVPVVKLVKEKTWAALGNEFEGRVVAKRHRLEGVLQPSSPKQPLEERLTASFLRGEQTAPYAAQPNLTPRGRPAFLEGTDLALKRNLPDLIRYAIPPHSSHPAFTVIDVKATRRATPFHKTQVAFYVRVLEELLKEMGISAQTRLDDHGEVWRIPDHGFATGEDYEVDRFALGPYLRLVDDFCQNILPGIAAKKVLPAFDETFFHIYFKCEQCEFVSHCTQSIDPSLPASIRDVSAVPGLTHEAKRSLRRLGVRSVADLSEASGLAKSPGIGWSLTRRAPLLTTRAQALASGKTLRTIDEHTFLMPPRADIALLLSIDHDPVDDRIAAIGYRRVEGGKVVNQRVELPRSGGLEHEAQAMLSVLSALIEDLASIDRANATGQELYAHIFFYEPSEAVTLQKALGRHLENAQIRGGLLHLVRLFPPEEVVPEPEFRGVHHLPATAVRSVVEQLYALPVAVSYDLRQVSHALAAQGGGPAYTPAPGFTRQFSSLLSIDVIRPIREEKLDAPTYGAVEADVAARLDALQGVIGWLYAENLRASAPLLRLNKKPFRFQATFDPLNAVDLDILLACELLENRAGLLEALVGLAQPADRRRDAGRCMSGLTLTHHGIPSAGRSAILTFNVPEASRVSELGPGSFNLILTDDDPDLRLGPGNWPTVRCSILPPSDNYPDRPDRVAVRMDARIYQSAAFDALLRRTATDGWFIDQAFGDVNSARAAAFLSNLAGGLP